LLTQADRGNVVVGQRSGSAGLDRRALRLAYVRLARAPDTAIAMVGTLVGARLSGADAGIGTQLLLALSNALLSAASMSFNDWHDVAEDRINRPDRPVPSGLVPRHRALLLAGLWFVTAGTLASAVSASFGALALAVGACSAAYTLWWKRVPVAGNLIVALLSAYPFWCWFAWSGLTSTTYALLAACLVLFCTGRELIHTAEDVRGDAALRIPTVATLWGPRLATRAGVGVIAASAALAWVPVIQGDARWPYVWSLALATAIVAYATHLAYRTPGTRSRRIRQLARLITLLMAAGAFFGVPG
jgi:geranylgeranylglycerol-phosphate geranylgeranyltransferase